MWGCIPTKMFVYAADVADTVRSAQRYGVHASFERADWPAIVERVFGRIDPISAGGKEYRVERCPNITVYPSHAWCSTAVTATAGTGSSQTVRRCLPSRW